jgi:Opioid growth factor receptor (OGFr) conserved region
MDVVHEQWLRFYGGQGRDDHGRLLREIQNWPDDQLEYTHDYIQWLFPLDERSGFNPEAPVLDAGTMAKFLEKPENTWRLKASLDRMLAFYGLEWADTERTIRRAASFAEQAKRWLTPGNHNHLRMTRILKSLRLLGLPNEAQALFACLQEIYEEESGKSEPGITERSFRFWRGAAGA